MLYTLSNGKFYSLSCQNHEASVQHSFTLLILPSLIPQRQEFNTPLLVSVKNNVAVEVVELLIEKKAFLEARNTKVIVYEHGFLEQDQSLRGM